VPHLFVSFERWDSTVPSPLGFCWALSAKASRKCEKWGLAHPFLISTREGAPLLSRFPRQGGDFDFLSPPQLSGSPHLRRETWDSTVLSPLGFYWTLSLTASRRCERY
jgi:hypothetical protein